MSEAQMIQLCNCKDHGVDTPDSRLMGYDWHQHEYRFVCYTVGCIEYSYYSMSKPWHDMDDEEKKFDLDLAHKAMDECQKCHNKRYLV